jgi:hypothetical protein
MGFSVQPYASGWSWAYRGGSWYAIRSTSLRQFECQAVALSAHRVGMKGMAYRYPNSDSRFMTLTAGATYYPLCANGIKDATGLPSTYTFAWVMSNGAWTKAYIVTDLVGLA